LQDLSLDEEKTRGEEAGEHKDRGRPLHQKRADQRKEREKNKGVSHYGTDENQKPGDSTEKASKEKKITYGRKEKKEWAERKGATKHDDLKGGEQERVTSRWVVARATVVVRGAPRVRGEDAERANRL